MLLLEDILSPVRIDFERYEQAYVSALRTDDELLRSVLTYLSEHRGKQLRPLLVLLSAQVCRGITSKTIQTAIAMELLHTSSLIHDDVVDESPLRRGVPAVQAKWSNQVAVLVGDYLLARVIALISDIRSTRILSIVSSLGMTLSAGELAQLHYNGSMWITEEQYYRVIGEKTAALFQSCAEAGGESCGATMRQLSALRVYGYHLGMCFQMQDDVLDYSDSEELGKPTMHDIADGKATLPLLVSLARAPRSEAEEIRHLSEELASHSSGVDIVRAEQDIKSFVLRYDGVRYAYQQMQRHKQQALQALAVFRESNTKSSLMALSEYAIHRLH